jgi:hypothetical protein
MGHPPGEIGIEINVKGSGQECPLHTGNGKEKARSWDRKSKSPLLAEDARNGAPSR